MSLKSYRTTYKNFLIEDYIKSDRIEYRPGACILDFGCGPGWSIVGGLDLGFDMWGLDIGPDYIVINEPWEHKAYHKKYFKIEHRLKWYDGTYWPYPDRMFDVITAIVSWDKDFSEASTDGLHGKKFFLRHEEALRTLKDSGYLLTHNGGLTRYKNKSDIRIAIDRRRG